MKLVFIGPPGSGKGTLSKILATKLDLSHISTGDIIRHNINHKTPLGLQAKQILENGELVSDDMMMELVKLTLTTQENKTKGYILDGFPRTIAQTEWFMKIFEVDYYVFFNISKDTIIERISGRRIHPTSNRIYHIKYAPPNVENKDDITGENLIQREDDKPKKIKIRLAVYQKQTFPIIEYIKKHATNYCSINAEQPEQTVANEAITMLNISHPQEEAK